MSRRRHPPRIAEALLRRNVPAGPRGHSIIGDFREEYLAVSQRRGLLIARGWYWYNALLLTVQYSRPFDSRKRKPTRTGLNHGVFVVIGTIVYDIRHSLRSFRRKPAFYCAVLVVFALGIGANTVIFSVVNGDSVC